jgi:hypothetical protein
MKVDSTTFWKLVAPVWVSLGILVGCSNEAEFSGSPTKEDRREPVSQDVVQNGGPSPSKPKPTPPLSKVLRQEFNASDLLQGGIKLTVGSQSVSEKITMRADRQAKAREFTQLTRSKVTEFVKQGHPGMTKTETFGQMNLGVLDLLIVVDNSGSMSDEQQNLAARLDPLMQFVMESDWRINIVTSDPGNGCSRAIIRRGDPNVEATFRSAIMAGTNGNGNEQGIRMAVEGLSCPQANWLRPNSSIAVLFVSDEDNCSNRGRGCQAPYNSPNYLINHLSQNLGRVPGKNARIYGLIWQPNTTCSSAYNVGYQYAELIGSTGGKSGSICDPDYAATLRSISSDVATLLNSDFELASIPDQGSVKIFVNGVEQVGGYAINGKTLHFDPKPTYGAKIEVTYTTGATPMLSKHRVRSLPAPQTLVVMVNGQLLNPAQYRFDSQSMEVVFLSPPPPDADIQIEFRENTPLVSKFPIGEVEIAGSVQVKVNGQSVSDYIVTSDHSVQFTNPPLDNASVTVIYQTKGNPLLNYPIRSQEPLVKDLKVIDSDTGEELFPALDNGALRFLESDFRDGRRLTVTYKDPDAGHLLTKLPSLLVSNSLRVRPEEGSCGFDVQGSELELNCDSPSGTTVHLSWQIRSPVRQEYTMDGILNPDQGVWTVLIDGQPTEEYTRSGKVVTITEPLEPEAVVTLILEGSR